MKTVSLAFVFAVCWVGTVAGARPNVVLILSDDQAWADYGFMGHDEIQTPHLDRLAERALVFPRGYVTAPLCRPSLASIISGLYPHQHGTTGNDVTPARGRQRENEGRAQIDAFNARPGLISELVKSGYLAFQSGKWWEGSWKDGHFTDGMTHGIAEKGGRHGDEGLTIGRNGIKPVADFIDKAVAEQKPFFVWYAPFLPHSPHNPPERLLKKYSQPDRPADEARYFAMCDWLDETCGELIGHLEKRKLTDNTLIVYLCDNGWRALSRSDVPVPKNWDQRFSPRSKGSPYENGIRTPIMFSLPGQIEPGKSDDLASSIDLLPTILKLCGVQSPDKRPGIDLLDTQTRQARKQIFGAAYSIHNMTVGDPDATRQYRWIITSRWKYLKRDHGLDTTNYKYVHLWDQAPERLFDLHADPGESKDLVSTHPEVATELRERLEAWLK